MRLIDELERASGSPSEGAPELRVHAVLCGHRINTMPALAALEEASSSVLVAQRLNEEGERAWVVNDLIDSNTGILRIHLGSDSERQLMIYAVHPTSTADGAVTPHAPEGDSERPGAGAVTPRPVSDEPRVNPEAAKEMTELRPSYDLKQMVRKLRDPDSR